MPVLRIECPDCGHAYPSMVMEGAKVPEVWVCSRCGGRRAEPLVGVEAGRHPLADGHAGCSCCG